MNSTTGQPTPERPAISHPGTQPGRRRASPAGRIVVGVDGSAGSAAALCWAVAEACRRHAALLIVSAWEAPDPVEPGFARPGDRAQMAAERAQKALARVLLEPHQPDRIGCAMPEGTPGKVLLDQAEGADLLVLGTTGISTEQAPGPTGQYCLRHAHGPVVFVPAPA